MKKYKPMNRFPSGETGSSTQSRKRRQCLNRSNKRGNRFKLNSDPSSIALFIAAIAWMALIFFMSSQTGDDSSFLSGFVSDSLTKFANSIYGGHAPAGLLELIENGFILRKAGHAFEYLVLGILVYSLIRRQGVKRKAILSIIICAVYAASDEFHQMFVPDRGPMLADVLLDSVSSAAGVLVSGGFRRKRAGRT